MVAMATAFKESQKFYQKFIFGMKANLFAKFEVNLRTLTYHPLHDFYMNLYLTISRAPRWTFTDPCKPETSMILKERQ